MAEQKKHKHDDAEFVEIEPVKQIEVETKDLVVSSKLFIYMIIGLLTYLIFMVIPSIEGTSTKIIYANNPIIVYIHILLDATKSLVSISISFTGSSSITSTFLSATFFGALCCSAIIYLISFQLRLIS